MFFFYSRNKILHNVFIIFFCVCFPLFCIDAMQFAVISSKNSWLFRLFLRTKSSCKHVSVSCMAFYGEVGRIVCVVYRIKTVSSNDFLQCLKVNVTRRWNPLPNQTAVMQPLRWTPEKERIFTFGIFTNTIASESIWHDFKIVKWSIVLLL